MPEYIYDEDDIASDGYLHGLPLRQHARLQEVFKFLGVRDIAYNQPKSLPYPTENPFA